MTVPLNNYVKGPYVGNGVAVAFNGPMAYVTAQIMVMLKEGLDFTAVPTSAYSVTNLGRTSGTTITLDAAPTSAQSVYIYNIAEFSQQANITNQGAFNAEVIEQAYDYLAMQIQRIVATTLQLIHDPDTGEFVWDAQGHRLINLAAALNLTDATNLGQVLALIEEGSGGGLSVTPRVYRFVGEDDETDFFMEGADVDDPAFYDSYIEQTVGAGDFVAIRPLDDFTVQMGVGGAYFRFGNAPEDGIRAFTVLRGYARPYTGPTPITSTALNIRILSADGDTLDTDDHYSLIGTTETAPVELIIRGNTGAANDWLIGQFCSVVPLGTGEVTIVADGGVNLIVPPGFEPKTRATGCVISMTCINPDQGDWLLSGDLKRTAVEPNYFVFTITDRVALSGTNIVVGTNKGNFVMPFDVRLRSIANRGLYGSLIVAQAAGAAFTVDVNRNGTSIISTKLVFDNAEQTTLTAATPAVYAAGGDLLAAGDIISIDVDVVGTALAKGLSVYLVCERV